MGELLKNLTFAAVTATLAITLAGCAVAADGPAVDTTKAPAQTAAPTETEAPVAEVTYVPAPTCWNVPEPAGYQYVFAVTPEEAKADYEAQNGVGSAEENGTTFSCAMRTAPGNDVAAADLWMDGLVSEGWTDTKSTSNDGGAVRTAMPPDQSVIAEYAEFGEGEILFALRNAADLHG
ncbi:hypothetical protein [Microbacterium caowuchunii]|uniref:Lipoprotein n=1 Tax=Microbacterium caowuchunii TaxID=2614638 RepID=A0A5N0TJ62_9MICO|nr:hypothetical protein [Microbacterium caowuchunii]KAA9135150.1 hypothetical protein F6B40_05620 [Microbacterium caowuchunii]